MKQPDNDSDHALLNKLFDRGILDLCQEVHMHTTGSADNLSCKEAEVIVDYLKLRLKLWEPGPSRNARYDEAVIGLMSAAIAEYDSRLEQG